jgi:hypothetical protein
MQNPAGTNRVFGYSEEGKNEILAVQAQINLPKKNQVVKEVIKPKVIAKPKKKSSRKKINISFDMNDSEERALYEKMATNRYDKRNHRLIDLLLKYWDKKDINHEEVIHNLSKFISTVTNKVPEGKIVESPTGPRYKELCESIPQLTERKGFVNNVDLSTVKISEPTYEPKKEEDLEATLEGVFNQSVVFKKPV